LLEAGGFNEDFFLYGMEDIELGYRLEKLGVQMINGNVHEQPTNTFQATRNFIDRCEQAGYSLGKLIELHPILEKRFVESGRWTRLLKRLHPIYRVSSESMESAYRGLPGGKPTEAPPDLFHACCNCIITGRFAIHFFLGYNQYRQHALSGHDLHNVIQFGRPSLPDLALQRHKTDRSSAKSARMS